LKIIVPFLQHFFSYPETNALTSQDAVFSHVNYEPFFAFPQVEVVPKSKDEVLQIRKALKANVFLKGLDAKQVTQLIDCMTKESLKKGKNAITEGELGDRLFVLDSGRVRYSVPRCRKIYP